MHLARRPKIVVLGLMSRKPVAGVIWQTLHYLVGLERLGYEVYYVEAHAGAPIMLMAPGETDGSDKAATFIDAVLRPYGFDQRWAFHALHADGRCYGLTESALKRLYQSAALIINLHGATVPRPEHAATGRLVYLETDPVALQLELYDGRPEAIAFLAPHGVFFTFAENYGGPDCRLPYSERFAFHPTRQPIAVDLWQMAPTGGSRFTTIGNWNQAGREVRFQGETYHWSKHLEFLRFRDLPSRSGEEFELALTRYNECDQRMLESHGWKVLPALEFSTDPTAYRAYIGQSRAEFTVAKDQNVRLRTGWFSDRSATYLAAGRPVVTQDTGFGNLLPTGEGLFSFSTMDEILDAIETINADYAGQCRSAAELAREYFNYDVVLGALLARVGL